MRSFASLVSVITALSVMGSPASSRVASAVCASIGWAVVDGAAAVADWGAAALVPDSVAWAVASAESPPPQPAVSAAAAMVMMIVLRMRWVSAGRRQLGARWMLRRSVRVLLSRSMSCHSSHGAQVVALALLCPVQDRCPSRGGTRPRPGGRGRVEHSAEGRDHGGGVAVGGGGQGWHGLVQQVRQRQWAAEAERGGHIAGVATEQDRPALGHHVEAGERSEEHTSELQSRQYLVCRLL